MAVLRIILCAVFMVNVALSKPVFLSDAEDASKSSESSESDSSEETAAQVEASREPLQQPAMEETDVPNAMEETDPISNVALLPSAAASPSPTEDPQTSTDADAVHPIPDDPSQTALGMDISEDMPHSDPVLDPINTDTEHVLPHTEVSLHPRLTQTDIVRGSDQPPVTATITYQGFPLGTTPPFPPHTIRPSSTATSLPMSVGSTLTGVPVCFTFQFTTSEPDPSRGDNM